MNSLISSALSISFCLSFLLSVCQRRWRLGFSLGWRRELIRSCQGVTSGKSSDGELALSPGQAVWMVLHIKGNKGKTKTSKKRDRNRWEKQVVTSLVKWKIHPKMTMGQQAPKFKFGQITSTWFNLINSKIFTILHHPYCCYVYTLYNLFAHSYCTYLLLITFTFMHLTCIQVTVSTFYQLLLSLGIEPMILALLTPCSYQLSYRKAVIIIY